MPFIDWLHAFQRHNGGQLPVVAGGAQVREDYVKETLSESFRWLAHKGSHETNVMVRCDGAYVELSGNPGRFGRPDNVFNLDWDDTLAKSNGILAGVGLPGFTAGEHYLADSLSRRDIQQGLSWDRWTGARVSELHVTENYAAGSSGMARDWLRYVTGFRAARLSKSRLGAETVVFGSGKSTRQIEVYLKGAELLAHAKGEAAKAAMRASELYQYCQDNGVVRLELKARRGFLRDHGLNYVGGIRMGEVINIFERETQFLLDASPDQCARLVDDMPAKLRVYALAWLRGDNVAALVSRATFYRVAKALRGYGIDISEPRLVGDGATDKLQVMLDALPKFALRPLRAPEWYDAAEEYRVAA